MIGQTISHYRILRKLGAGAMSIVYVAEDVVLKRQVALKVLIAERNNQHFHQRMLREARAISSLNHRNIATIHEYGETSDGIPYIVMELVDGQTLSELISGGSLTLTRVLKIIEAVAEGLAEAHHHKIVNRDIKPSNIAINERGEVKVLDFGLAKRLISDHDVIDEFVQRDLLATQTREGVIIGTPMYLSPEQALGVRADARSDLFSLGALLYECIAGRPAFDGKSAIEICAKVARDDPPPPSRFNKLVPRSLDEMTLKALAKKAEDRYQSAEDMLRDLRAIRLALPKSADAPPAQNDIGLGHAPRASLITTLTDSLRRPRLYVGAFVLSLCLALLTFGIVSMFHRKNESRTPSVEAMNYYRDGTNALRDGPYLKAVRALEQAVKLADDFPPARVRLAEAYAELDYTDKAKNELLRVNAPGAELSALQPLDALYLQAIRFKLGGNSGEAIKKYNEIVQQAPDSEKAAAYVDLGRAYERDGNSKKATESYEEAHRLDPQFTAASMHLGVLHGRNRGQEETRAALSAFQDAERRYQILNDVEGQAEVLYERGVFYMAASQYSDAREQLAQSRLKSEAIDNKYQQIKIRLQLSTLFCISGDTEKAAREAEDVLAFAKENGLENLTANGLINLGNAFAASGEAEQAEKYLKQALEVAQYYKARRSEGKALLALASFYTGHQGKADRIRELVERAASINEQEGYRKYAMQSQAILGQAYVQQGNYPAALSAFAQQLALAEQMDNQEQEGLAHEGFGITLAYQEDYPKALDHLKEDVRISKSLEKLKPNVAHALLNQGNVLWQLGRYPEAKAALTEAIRLANDSEKPDQEFVASHHLIMAQLWLSQHEFASAQGEGILALRGSEKNRYDEVTAEAKYTLGLAKTLAGFPRAGQKLCDDALDIATRIGNQRLIYGATLARSLALLEAGDAPAALEAALKAQEGFARSGQRDSEWHAWLVAARAAERQRDTVKSPEFARHASVLLADLESKWPPVNFRDYNARLDVQYFRKQLEGLLVRP